MYIPPRICIIILLSSRSYSLTCNPAGAPYNRDCHHKPPVGMATVQAPKNVCSRIIVVIVGPASETAFPRSLASLVNVDSGSDY